MKTPFFSIQVVLGFLLLVLNACERRSRHDYPSDSDQSALSFFDTHKGEFEKLRVLIEKHPFIYVNTERKDVSPPGALNDAVAKSEILKLLSDLKLESANGTQSSWGVRLTFTSSGMAVGSTTKSFFYSKVAPKNLVPSTEGFVPNTTESSSVFRKIDDNWYLQFEWGG